MSKITEILEAIQSGNKKNIQGLVEEALKDGLSPQQILSQGMIRGMDVIGEKFKAGEAYVPEMLIAARCMKAGVEVLKPHLVNDDSHIVGKFIVGTVEGDLHDIGKNLVAMLIESAGFNVIDLGVDVKPETFVEAIKNNPDCQIVGLSALLTTTMPALKATIEAIHEAGLNKQVKVLVGGAPITQEHADMIGADGFAADAATAASIAKQIVA